MAALTEAARADITLALNLRAADFVDAGGDLALDIADSA